MKKNHLLLSALVLVLTSSCSDESKTLEIQQENNQEINVAQRNQEPIEDLGIVFTPNKSISTKYAPIYDQTTGNIIGFDMSQPIGYYTYRSNGTPVWVDNTCVNVNFLNYCEVHIPMMKDIGSKESLISVYLKDKNTLRMVLGTELTIKSTDEIRESLISTGFSEDFSHQNADLFANSFVFHNKAELIGDVKTKLVEKGLLSDDQILLINAGNYNYQYSDEYPNAYFDVPFFVE